MKSTKNFTEDLLECSDVDTIGGLIWRALVQGEFLSVGWSEWTIWYFGHLDCGTNIFCGCFSPHSIKNRRHQFHLPPLVISHLLLSLSCLVPSHCAYVCPHTVYFIDLKRLSELTNWYHGHVNCGANILLGCWLLWQNKIMLLTAGHHSFQNFFLAYLTHLVISHFPPRSFPLWCCLLPCLHTHLLTCSPCYSITLSFTFSFTRTSWINKWHKILPLKIVSSSIYFSVSSSCCCYKILL